MGTLMRKERRQWYRTRSEEHTSELQSQSNLVCRLLLEKKNDSVRPTANDQRPMAYGSRLQPNELHLRLRRRHARTRISPVAIHLAPHAELSRQVDARFD